MRRFSPVSARLGSGAGHAKAVGKGCSAQRRSITAIGFIGTNIDPKVEAGCSRAAVELIDRIRLDPVGPVRQFDLGVEAANWLAAGEELFSIEGLFSLEHEIDGTGKLGSENRECFGFAEALL